MATTSLWHIEGRLKDLISYVENPEKTRAENPSLQPLWDKNSDICSAHYIREKVVEQLVLESMQRVLWYVQSYEKLFAQRQLEEFGEKRMYHLQGDTEAGKAFAIGGELSANSLYQDVQTNINE